MTIMFVMLVVAYASIVAGTIWWSMFSEPPLASKILFSVGGVIVMIGLVLDYGRR